MNQMPGESDLHRPPGPRARRQGAQRPELAPHLRLAHRLLLVPEVPLQHLALVAADDAADPALRQHAVPASARPSTLGVGITPEPHGALGAGLVALLGVERPADGGGFLPRRVLVRRLRHRAAAPAVLLHRLGQHQHQPARHHGRERHARLGLQRERRAGCRRPASSVRAAGSATSSTTRKLATQLRRLGRPQPRSPATPTDDAPPNATQIKLSDGVNPFDAGALAEGVTVQKLDYDEMAVDAGVKYRGFSFQSEYYFRRLSDFQATGPVPLGVHRRQRLPGAGDAHGRAAPARRLPHVRQGVRRLRPEPLGDVRRGELLPEPARAAGG